MTPIDDQRSLPTSTGAAAAPVSLNPLTTGSAPTPGPDHGDTRDFADADRGFVAAFTGGQITHGQSTHGQSTGGRGDGGEGRTVWDPDAYAFVAAEAPATADPSLWRQAQLLSRQGLYQVTERIYQVRGLDLSNMTIVEGDTGIIVIDPLISAETAAAALALYRAHRGDREVRAMIYTHPHLDHFGGCHGVLPDGAGTIPILAPQGFMDHAVSENIYVGAAMSRRAAYMYGAHLPVGAAGQLGCGLGLRVSLGTVGLIAPTRSITATGEEVTLDGVRIQFQMTPGTECQEEMNFLFPDLRAVCMAENATHTMHNILTLRGAQVRDAHAWASYLTESIGLYRGRADVAFASHHWPTWGDEEIIALLTNQRDMYAYMHDQTVRLINQGLTGTEIAETFELPPAVGKAWANRGYYGSLSHNVKAIYQRYLGWFDGNPAHLWEHPPVEEAKRWVECLGGNDAVREHARRYADGGDLRFAVTLLNHAVFNDPDDTGARTELAELYTRLGHGAENAVWRNFYLTGAMELTQGIRAAESSSVSPGMYLSLSVGQLIDGMAVRLNGPRAWDTDLAIDWVVADAHWHLRLANGVLTWTTDRTPAPGAGLTMTMTKPQLLLMLGGMGTSGITMCGDASLITALFALLDPPNQNFPMVTP